ncbi:AraC family transcriptional regulator [Heyndrickxia shackletonii]|uniref:AraC family transcriptional regulator n=2 Tax=Bacillaceae TaxID=186817 RepID=A0A0Q3TA59_9BACI|nr:AraC family transcriptional regulator [Heyndrickxia shackletonii]
MKAVKISIDYMKKNIDTEITSEELAYLVGYSTYHYSRIFKEITGVSPRHYLSALRMEAGKEMLISSKSPSILKILLLIGFRSLGTFSSKFKQFVGLSPKQFQLSTNDLHDFVNDYKDKESPLLLASAPPILSCHLEVPATFKGIIFVGLFPRAIPDQKPIIGTAFTQNQTSCVFSDIPLGTYYVLAAALKWSVNPKDYFLLNRALRGKYDKPIEITKFTDTEITISLREPLPTDPPILVNLPQLLYEQVKKKAN